MLNSDWDMSPTSVSSLSTKRALNAEFLVRAIKSNDWAMFRMYLRECSSNLDQLVPYDLTAKRNAPPHINTEFHAGNSYGVDDPLKIPILFFAIRNVFENPPVMPWWWLFLSDSPHKTAMRIFQAFLTQDARLDTVVDKLRVGDTSGWTRQVNAEKLVHMLIEIAPDNIFDTRRSMMVELLRLIHSKRMLRGHNGSASNVAAQPMARVPLTVLNTYSSLLLNEDFSDVRLKCFDPAADECDGSTTTFPAHRCVLAASSKYFHSMFTGAWTESSAGAVVTVAYDAVPVRAMLEYVYTGSMDKALLETHHLALLTMSAEYLLTGLQELAEQKTLSLISRANVKDTLVVADRHAMVGLKAAAYRYIRSNASSLLTQPHMLALATTEPELWGEMSAAIAEEESGGGE